MQKFELIKDSTLIPVTFVVVIGLIAVTFYYSGRNNPSAQTVQGECARFAKKYGTELKEVIDWIDSKDIDSGFVAEYWLKQNRLGFSKFADYDTSGTARLLEIESAVPKKFLHYFSDIWLKDIVKFRKDDYYLVAVGSLKKDVRALVLQKGKKITDKEIEIRKKELGIQNQHWVFVADDRLVFTNWGGDLPVLSN